MSAAKPIAILQFGVTGQLARELRSAADGRSELSVQTVSRDQADFRNPQQVADVLAAAEPVDLVVNATAYTAVDKAESESDLARRINTESVGALAKACHAKGVPLIHVSTDYVFDGCKPEPYVETDAPNPLGVYGRTKLEGEEAVRAATDRHVILRTSWVYSAHGSNFVKTMLRLGAERDEIRVVDDQHGAPTSARDLAQAILAIAGQIAAQASSQHFGTFHYTSRGETTWRRFAEAVFDNSRSWAGLKAAVTGIPTSEYPTPARRPLNSRLDCTKIDAVYDIERPSWSASLARVLEEIRAAGETS